MKYDSWKKAEDPFKELESLRSHMFNVHFPHMWEIIDDKMKENDWESASNILRELSYQFKQLRNPRMDDFKRMVFNVKVSKGLNEN